MDATTPATRAPSLGALFLAFGKIGLLSFGGGSTTLVLMEQEIVRRQWMTSHQFLFSMALSRMWPGVHLIAQAVLIGHLLRGFVGGMVCMLGMMLPATAITVLFTAFWLVLRENSLGTGMIQGVLPATAGLSFAVANGFEAQVRPRSGLALRHGVTCLNTPGTIDSDFRGEVQVILANLGEEDFTIRRGDRIAQLVICPVARAEWAEVEKLGETARGGGGFGSTGRGDSGFGSTGH